MHWVTKDAEVNAAVQEIRFSQIKSWLLTLVSGRVRAVVKANMSHHAVHV